MNLATAWALFILVAAGALTVLALMLALTYRQEDYVSAAGENPDDLHYCADCGCRHRAQWMTWTPEGKYRCTVCCLDYPEYVSPNTRRSSQQ